MGNRNGGCNLTPCPKNCLNCPFPDCINNRPVVAGEMSVEKYVDMKDGINEVWLDRVLTRYMRTAAK